MKIPLYSFSIPRYTIKNYRLQKLRRSFPIYLITPVSVTVVNPGEMSKEEDGKIYVNMQCKTVTILSIYNRIKKFIRGNTEAQ